MSIERANQTRPERRELFPELHFAVYANHAPISPLSGNVTTRQKAGKRSAHD
jgi:hypothetical protein